MISKDRRSKTGIVASDPRKYSKDAINMQLLDNYYPVSTCNGPSSRVLLNSWSIRFIPYLYLLRWRKLPTITKAAISGPNSEPKSRATELYCDQNSERELKFREIIQTEKTRYPRLDHFVSMHFSLVLNQYNKDSAQSKSFLSTFPLNHNQKISRFLLIVHLPGEDISLSFIILSIFGFPKWKYSWKLFHYVNGKLLADRTPV